MNVRRNREMYLLFIIAEEEPIEIQDFIAVRHFESKRSKWVHKRLDCLSLAI